MVPHTNGSTKLPNSTFLSKSRNTHRPGQLRRPPNPSNAQAPSRARSSRLLPIRPFAHPISSQQLKRELWLLWLNSTLSQNLRVISLVGPGQKAPRTLDLQNFFFLLSSYHNKSLKPLLTDDISLIQPTHSLFQTLLHLLIIQDGIQGRYVCSRFYFFLVGWKGSRHQCESCH